jgi:hypothetical protein
VRFSASAKGISHRCLRTTQCQVDALCEAFARTVREKSSRLAALVLVRGFFWNDFDPAAFTSID